MLTQTNFEQHLEGRSTKLIILQNHNGMSVVLTNYGARIVGLNVPVKHGKVIDVVMGFSDLKDYFKADCPYYGATIGRYANRIAEGRFELNHKKYELTLNEGRNHLHGGNRGLHDQVWDIQKQKEECTVFAFTSFNQEEGYPGTLNVQVTFKLTEENSLEITYLAQADEDTILNLTNHAYFNLNGENNHEIVNHKLQLFADYYTPVDEFLIPTGTIDSVFGTPFDFRNPRKIGERIHLLHPQLIRARGYDHNFVLNKTGQDDLSLAAKIWGEKSGIVMEVMTTEPGLQFYSGNFMKGKDKFKYGHRDQFRTAFCLETQHFPDSPNHPYFPKTVLEKGEIFFSRTIYHFSAGDV